MSNHISVLVVICLSLLFMEQAFSQVTNKQRSLYQRHFLEKTYNFLNENRFRIGNVNRDKYIDCYMLVGIEVTVEADGAVKELSIKDPSLLQKVDTYFSYIIKQASPFDPLKQYFDDDLQELTFTKIFRLNIRLYEFTKVSKPCS